MTHQTFRSVTAYDIFGSDSLRFAVGRFDLSHDAIRVLRKTLKFGFPQNITLMLSDIFVKKMFGFALLQHQHKRKGTQALSNVGKLEVFVYRVEGLVKSRYFHETVDKSREFGYLKLDEWERV